MLKGAQYAAINPEHRQALYEAAALASGGQIPFVSGSSSSHRRSEQPEKSKDDESESEYQSDTKGKRIAKGERKS